MDLNLEGKRAVVTGASLGIGEASVKHGFKVLCLQPDLKAAFA